MVTANQKTVHTDTWKVVFVAAVIIISQIFNGRLTFGPYFTFLFGLLTTWSVLLAIGYCCFFMVLKSKIFGLEPSDKLKPAVNASEDGFEDSKSKKTKQGVQFVRKCCFLVEEVCDSICIQPESCYLEKNHGECKIEVASKIEISPVPTPKEMELPTPEDDRESDIQDDVTYPESMCQFEDLIVNASQKINQRKPMVFVGGVSASCSAMELVLELKHQGFNVTVVPRIRYGVSFGFCPDLVLSSEDEVQRILTLGRIWIKDRWIDVRPYVPKYEIPLMMNGTEDGKGTPPMAPDFSFNPFIPVSPNTGLVPLLMSPGHTQPLNAFPNMEYITQVQFPEHPGACYPILNQVQGFQFQ